jgi:2-desacetyl-2-hydroxyethyl bacteriochlorophyllide A dehydrogenase
MKAALLIRPGEIVIDDVPEPEFGAGEVRIAVGGVGLCGSDLSVFSGAWNAPSYPWIMGHEAFGKVEAVGAGVDPGRIGQTVVVEPNVACLSCPQCRRGVTSACVARQSVGMNRPGALAERLVIPSRFAWPISGVAPSDLVCVEPTTVVTAALRRLGVAPPATVLVVGVGAQGLLMALALVERGVEVQVRDVNQARVALAAGLGAVAASTDDGPRFELVVDTVGSPSSTAFSLARVEVGGTILLLGLDSRPLEFTAQTLVRRQAVLRGSLTYDHPSDFEAAVRDVADGGFRPGRIVTEEYPLANAQAAFDRSASAPGKTWIRVAADAETY